MKEQSELVQGERLNKDSPHGWLVQMADTTSQHGADIMILLKQSTPAGKIFLTSGCQMIPKKATGFTLD